MISTGAWRRLSGAVLALILSLGAAPAGAADVTLFRIFLDDGTSLVSYGEFARVADKVVVSLPIGAGDPPHLELVSLPASRIDWEKTDAYADSARAARYAATRGPEEFALLQQSVSRALSDIAVTADPQRKIAMAREARQNVTRWVAEHFGYHAEEVARLAGMFDDVVADVRRSTGQSNFDLSLVASMAVPPTVPLLPAPDARTSLEQGFAAANLVQDPSERASLLRAIHDTMATGLDPGTASLKTQVERALAGEAQVERSYAALSRRVLRAATLYAAQADVRALNRLAVDVLQTDDKLGHQRPNETASLLAMLDAKLDGARRLRLARDQWAARQAVRRQYLTDVAEPLATLRWSRISLDAIQQMDGPAPATLAVVSDRVHRSARGFTAVKAPVELDAVHALLSGAMQLATRAIDGRREAIRSGSMYEAKTASAAAAGAILLLGRANEELRRLTIPPKAP